MALSDLRKNGMMSHLIDALDEGKDIGQYGRLVVAMVARHFLNENELVKLLAKDKSIDEAQANEVSVEVVA